MVNDDRLRPAVDAETLAKYALELSSGLFMRGEESGVAEL